MNKYYKKAIGLYKKAQEKRLTRKKGIGGLIFILTVAIMTFTLNATVKLSTINNVEYMLNSSLYFVSNKAAVNLYNTHAPSGSYSMVPRVLKSDYNVCGDFNAVLNDAYENGVSTGCPWVTVYWDRNTLTATVTAGPVEVWDLGLIYPNEQKIIIEK